jgi:hypothetical protein
MVLLLNRSYTATMNGQIGAILDFLPHLSGGF